LKEGVQAAPVAVAPVTPAVPSAVVLPATPEPVVVKPPPALPPSVPAPELVVELDDEPERTSSYSDECIPEGEREVDAAEEEDEVVETSEPVASEPLSEPVAEYVVENSQLSDKPSTIATIVIKDKEPYNFDACTVTSVVQLLPDESGIRKCVVSLRTHDFSPIVSITDIATAELAPQISAALASAFENYRSELSIRAADKVKKEKPAAKKTTKPAAKPAATESKAAGEPKDQQGLFGG
jgi:hypothetical protein